MKPLIPPTIIVRMEKGEADKTEFRFTDSFQIGRGRKSEIRIKDDIVSRPHAEIRFEEGKWWLHDLNSTNGIFVDGKKVDQIPLANNTRIIIGQFGPVLSFSIEDADQTDKTRVVRRSIEQYTDRYFGNPDEDLPWPNPELIREWWVKNKGQFRNGTRYLLGKPISPEQCQHVLRYGYQRQRAVAAIELAILNPARPIFKIRDPGFRQQKLLGLK